MLDFEKTSKIDDCISCLSMEPAALTFLFYLSERGGSANGKVIAGAFEIDSLTRRKLWDLLFSIQVVSKKGTGYSITKLGKDVLRSIQALEEYLDESLVAEPVNLPSNVARVTAVSLNHKIVFPLDAGVTAKTYSVSFIRSESRPEFSLLPMGNSNTSGQQTYQGKTESYSDESSTKITKTLTNA